MNTTENIKKGDIVLLQDGTCQRRATVLEDGMDSQGRIRVMPDGIPLAMSITTTFNNEVYVIKKL